MDAVSFTFTYIYNLIEQAGHDTIFICNVFFLFLLYPLIRGTSTDFENVYVPWKQV